MRLGILVVTQQASGKFPKRSTTMNPSTSLRKPPAAAFTLIELLTVIAIIAILMGLLFPVLSSAKNQARRQSAAVAIRNIVSACKSYQADYGKFPPVATALNGAANASGYYAFGDPSAGGAFKVGNENLFDVLRAISRGANANNALNKRQQKYFEMGKAKDPNLPRDGFIDGADLTKGTQGQLMDPWGTQYCIILDAADTGTIDMSPVYQDAAFQGTQNVLRVSAAALSMGQDGKIGTKGDKLLRKGTNVSDDIVSWQ